MSYQCSTCHRFIGSTRHFARPIGSGYAATYTPHVVGTCRRCGPAEADLTGFGWEDIFGDWDPEA